MCIRIIGASNRRYAYIGDIVVAVIKKAVPNSSLERSEVIRAVIVRACKELKRSNGVIIKYDDNAAVLIDKEGNPKGTRIFSAIARELRQLNFTICCSYLTVLNYVNRLVCYYTKTRTSKLMGVGQWCYKS